MKKVKVVYDRDKCISAVTCANLNPELWEMSREDAKANLKGSKKEGDKWVLETELTRYLQMACEQCPADVIEIFDLETGEKLF
ncbi:MAG: ferredoxin [Nanoarchaeota archaeon]|nr:ferredoxin [DPANN group archaeon]MBL7117017.1 ferredoxin [Nanoarchaeota archaeon]